jgi:chromosomal replication initiator protein
MTLPQGHSEARHAVDTDAQAIWVQTKDRISKTVGDGNYHSWIEPLSLMSVNEGVGTFAAPSDFVGSYVQRTFSDAVVRHLNAQGMTCTRIVFQTRSAAEPAPQAASAPRAPKATMKRQSDAWRDKFTFENFVVGKSNQLAYAAARRVAEGGPVPFNPLFLYGGSGLGKTHLMKAIVRELEINHPHLNVMFLDAQEYMLRFVQSIREKNTLGFKQLFRSVDVLVVDDMQFLAGKESTQEEFFHTFNALVDQGKQIILSSDKSPGEIERLEDRIVSRLQSGLVADVHPTDYELRLGILQCKLELIQRNTPEFDLSQSVLELLAHKISANVRALEGALCRLEVQYSLVRKPITIEMVRDCLSDLIRSSEKRITLDEIQRKVSEHFNIRMSEMVGPRRHRSIARPRQIAMYLSKELTNKSYPEIGRSFGGRDHTTVMHGIKQILKLKEMDEDMREDIQLLTRALEG